MSARRSFFIVDDDPYINEIMASLLQAAGHDVVVHTSSIAALPEILENRPDCVLADIMMPQMDGLELCRRLRENSALNDTKIIMVSSKSYDFDRARALKFGANGYLVKPLNVETFIDELDRLIADDVIATYWGVRGTLPVSGQRSLRYGGNTNCVSLAFPKGQTFIFDAGSGIKGLSDKIMAENSGRFEAKIFISHPHWDHINALPFFAPLYIRGNEFEILGASHGDTTMRELISAQMDGVYFPVTIREMGSRVYFRNLGEESLRIGDVTVNTMLLSHPGNCLGYRITFNGKSFCYVTDNELFLPSSMYYNERYVKKLADFVQGADVLVTDCTYADAEYEQKVGWGHSSVSQVAELAHRAGVKSLHLYHHDPDQDDDAIDDKLEQARAYLAKLGSSVRCIAPQEGESVKV